MLLHYSRRQGIHGHSDVENEAPSWTRSDLCAQEPWCFGIHHVLILAQVLRPRNPEDLVSKSLYVCCAYIRNPLILFLGFRTDGEEGHLGIMVTPPLHQAIYGHIFLQSTIRKVEHQ